jgi:hypothetical protein
MQSPADTRPMISSFKAARAQRIAEAGRLRALEILTLSGSPICRRIFNLPEIVRGTVELQPQQP